MCRDGFCVCRVCVDVRCMLYARLCVFDMMSGVDHVVCVVCCSVCGVVCL